MRPNQLHPPPSQLPPLKRSGNVSPLLLEPAHRDHSTSTKSPSSRFGSHAIVAQKGMLESLRIRQRTCASAPQRITHLPGSAEREVVDLPNASVLVEFNHAPATVKAPTLSRDRSVLGIRHRESHAPGMRSLEPRGYKRWLPSLAAGTVKRAVIHAGVVLIVWQLILQSIRVATG